MADYQAGTVSALVPVARPAYTPAVVNQERFMAEAKIPADIAAPSFEDALAELEKIVKQLEGGQGKLDDAIKSYERGAFLKRHCETKLREAQAKVEKIVLAADGTPGTKPLDVG